METSLQVLPEYHGNELSGHFHSEREMLDNKLCYYVVKTVEPVNTKITASKLNIFTCCPTGPGNNQRISVSDHVGF